MAVGRHADHRRSRSTASRACRPASCRSRTRATCIAIVQLPDGASLARTQKVLDKVQQIAAQDPRRRPGRHHRRRLGARQQRVARQRRRRLHHPQGLGRARQKAQDLLSLFTSLNQSARPTSRRRACIVLPPPPIQGIGNAAGFTMQVELRDGSFDLAKLQSVTDTIVANARTQSSTAARDDVVPRQRAAIHRRGRPR